MRRKDSGLPGGAPLQKEEDRAADGEDQEQHIGKAVQDDAGVYSGLLVLGDSYGLGGGVNFLILIWEDDFGFFIALCGCLL